MKNYISLLLIFTLVFCTIGGTAYCTDADIIQNPADGAVFYESPEAFVLSITSFEKVVLYLNGEFYAECAEDSVELTEVLPLGTHILKAVGIMADGSAVADVNSFSIKQKSDNSIGSWKTETITFDDLPAAYSSGVKMDDTVATDFSSKYGWDLTYNVPNDVLDRKITRIEGKNHATDPDDWAPLLSYGEVSSTIYGGNAGMNFAGASNILSSLKATGGKLSVEFDLMKSDRNVVLLYLPFSLWGEYASGYNPQYLFSSGSGVVRGTSTSVESNVRQIEDDRKNLEKIMGYKICGMAYPGNGDNADKVADIIKRRTAIKYARTTTSTFSFDLQENLFQFNPTIHHCDFENLFRLGREFLSLKTDIPKLFYIWGHSFEFDIFNDWDKMEEFLILISRKEDIFYGTNSEVLL